MQTSSKVSFMLRWLLFGYHFTPVSNICSPAGGSFYCSKLTITANVVITERGWVQVQLGTNQWSFWSLARLHDEECSPKAWLLLLFESSLVTCNDYWHAFQILNRQVKKESETNEVNEYMQQKSSSNILLAYRFTYFSTSVKHNCCLILRNTNLNWSAADLFCSC